ncbi:MAG: N-6 DNA methylase [Treponema sp.]|nr:N-6 DNA methylase [Treponema sp.]
MKTFEVKQDYDPKTFADFIYDFLPEDYSPKKQQAYFDYTNIEEGYKLGTCKSLNLDVYEFRTKSKRDPRVTLTREVVSLMKKYGYNQNALVVFYSNKSHNWRLSLITTDYEVVNDKVKPLYSNPRRFSFRLGAECKAHTPQTMLFKKGPINRHTENGREITVLEDLKSRFALEVVSKQFFNEYKVFYEDFVQYITGNRYVKTGKKGKYERKSVSKENTKIFSQFKKIACGDYDLACKYVRDYVKKFMGRLVFLQFLQKKGWLGVEENDSWGRGNKNFLMYLFSSTKYKNDFLKKVLEPLFFGMLNTDIRDRKKIFNSKEWDVSLLDDFKQIPYLNGGLFEDDILDSIDIKFPKEMFSNPAKAEKERTFNDKKDWTKEPYPFTESCGLLDFFARYNFTIDETDPADMEIGVEPEMLGKIFENLLEDNKDKGAFYTPKEIVQYMCRESLIAYLGDNDKIRSLVTNHVADFNDTERKELIQKLKSVKICDPAVGSGAFPMGMLNELFACRLALGENEDAAEIKKQIVRENIYGVDIEKGAVDIARLRFWLAIIVDEKEPIPLPNLDYKIMQGNSLLESYEGIDLSKLTKSNDELFDNAEIIQQLRDAIDGFYIPSDHIAKAKIRKQIREKVIQLLKDRQLPPATIKKLESIDLHSNSDFFLWHTWFSDVFNRPDKNGFDIVIGNPPYGASLSEENKITFKTLYSDVHMRTPESFCYFISLAFKLIRKEGIASFITPNNLFYQNENQKTRELLMFSNTLLRAINLGDNAFENADVPTGIFISKKINQTSSYKIHYSDYREKNIETIDWVSSIIKLDTEKQRKIPGFVLGMSSEGISLFDKIKSNGDLLDPLLEEMACGISTGGNKIFCIDKKEAQKHRLEKKHLYKVLNGYEMDKYVIKSDNKIIIYTTRDFDIENNPNIETYLLPFKSKLSKRSECKTGILPWYSMNRSRYEKLFLEPKIIFRQTSDSIRCTYDEDGWFVIDSVLVLKLNSNKYDYKYITGVLNSKATNYLYKNFTQEKGRGFAQVKPINIRKLYIPKIQKNQQQPIIALVDKILAAKKLDINADTSDLESQIDELVYTLYNLTEEEKNIIRGS